MSDEPARRLKQRTREHVIADLGMNFVERQILLAGFTFERFRHDYGLDLAARTYGPGGEPESGEIYVQVKATDTLTLHADGTSTPVRVASADLRAWLFEWSQVILVIYDAAGDRAFWVDVQKYAEEYQIHDDEAGETVTLRVPTANALDPAAVRGMRDRKQQAVRPRMRKDV